METIDMAPTWETAVRIYCTALQNPKAPASTKASAETDLLRLARMVDNAPKTSTPVIRAVVDIMLWRDNANGNTYHAAQVVNTSTGERHPMPFDYGNSSLAAAKARALARAKGLVPDDYRGLFFVERRGTRKETTAHGKGVQA